MGLLRGRSAVVLLDEDLQELQRLDAPASPTGLAVSPSGELWVSGEFATDITRYELHDRQLQRAGSITLEAVRSIRAIAYGPEGVLYAVEDHDHRLLTVSLGDHPGSILAGDTIGLGPRAVLRTARHVVVNCVLSHTVVVLPVDEHGVPRREGVVRITHNGPFWAVDAQEVGDGLLLAMGGVEDLAELAQQPAHPRGSEAAFTLDDFRERLAPDIFQDQAGLFVVEGAVGGFVYGVNVGERLAVGREEVGLVVALVALRAGSAADEAGLELGSLLLVEQFEADDAADRLVVGAPDLGHASLARPPQKLETPLDVDDGQFFRGVLGRTEIFFQAIE